MLILARRAVQSESWCSFGPDKSRSSTYTIKRSERSGNQKVLGWFLTASPPQVCMARVRCNSQCPPASGCPYRALLSLQQGCLKPRLCHSHGHSSRGILTYVSNVLLSFDCTYARTASACVVILPGIKPYARFALAV